MAFFSFFATPLSQFPSKFVIFVGEGILKDMKTILQIILAKGHEINKCIIVSFLSQKTHLSHPFQFHLAKLSFVRITPYEGTT
jgi:hypothetical protein